MTKDDDNFQLPTNVKQIGSITDKCRIYVEDYVSTYIEQYSASDNSKEKIAILVGTTKSIDDETVLFVSGVIQGKYTISRNGMTELTEKSWQYAQKQMSLYFKELEIIGWVYIQPGFEDYIGEKLCQFQKKNITRGLQILYVIDPSESISNFYQWDNNSQVFNNIKGYIVYYEKNEGMHEYMLENKLKPVEKKESTIDTKKADASALIRKIASGKRSLHTKHNSVLQEKNLLNLLGGVSFIMLLVCLVMGAGLVQNDQRITYMEKEIAQLEDNLDGSQSVFASQNETKAENTTEVPTEATVATTQEAVKETETQKQAEYVVKEGDTLIKISKNVYGNTSKVDEIREINNIENNKIVVGHKILLP